MYYPEDGYEAHSGAYGVDGGSNDVGGGRGPGVTHNMGHHPSAMFIPPHMMTMPAPSYMPTVPTSHQMHMQPMNVHSHLTSSTGSSLRTSSELSALSYSQPQSNPMSHRPTHVFHPSQSQQAPLGMPSSTGPSTASSSQSRVPVPMSANNISSQWPWPPPMTSKVTGMTANSSSSTPLSHSSHGIPSSQTVKNTSTTGMVPTSSNPAWGSHTSTMGVSAPRPMLSAASNSNADARFRTAQGAQAAPSSPNKYSSVVSGANIPSSPSGAGAGSSSSSSRNPSSSMKSVASFVASSNSKPGFYSYTPSSAMTGSGQLSMPTQGGVGASSSGVAGFQDASVYVPSQHQQHQQHGTVGAHNNAQHHSSSIHSHTQGSAQSASGLHAPSQHLTSSHHLINRPNPMEEYIAASLKRRAQLKASNSAGSGSGGATASGGANGLTSSQGHSRTASPAIGNAGASGNWSAQHSSPTKLSSLVVSSSPASGASAAAYNSLDTINWQVLDLSGMGLNAVSPQLSMYAQISMLHLQRNRLVSLPVEICTLSNLKFLDLSYNMLAWLPAEIGQLLSLKELYLKHNQLRSLPVEVGKLFRLNELALDENPIADIPLDVLSGGASAIVAHLRTLLAPTEPPPPRSWVLSATADRSLASPNYFHGLDAMLGPKAVRIMPGQNPQGHKQVTIQSKDVSKFRIEGSVRTMCYNILADIYAASLNYCPSWALAWNHRKTTVLKEIDLYSPDLLCLQEVVWAQYLHFFVPEMEHRGYKCVFHPKSRVKFSNDANRVDGCASFYRASMFEEVRSFNVEFQTLAQDNPERYCTPGDDAGWARLASKDNIAVGLILRRRDRPSLPSLQQSRQQAQQTIVGSGGKYQQGNQRGGGGNQRGNSPAGQNLQQQQQQQQQQHHHPEDDLLVFVNTHIHWDPDFSDVKLMQVQMLLEQLEGWVDEFSTPNHRIPLILGGDFNSTPDSGVYQLFVDGFLPGDHPDFLGYTYGNYTDEGLRHSFQLHSANASLAGEPAFTNYTGDFNGVLDYIWYAENSLTVERALNGVDESVIHAYNGALPNPHMPSDHIPLVADFVQNMNRRG